MRFAEVVVVLLDATIPFEKQDLTIVDLVEQEGRALVIGLNKWDLVADQPGLLKEPARGGRAPAAAGARRAGRAASPGLAGEGLDRLMEAVFGAYEVWNRRIPTARLNEWLGERWKATRRRRSRAAASRSAT